MPEDPSGPDPWRVTLDLRDEVERAAARDHDLAALLRREQRRFGTGGDDVPALLDEVDRRAIVDVEAPVDSSRPVVPQLKMAVRKANAFLSRHLAQQVTVLAQVLATSVRRLDERVRGLEEATEVDPSLLPEVRHARRFEPELSTLERETAGIRRDVRSADELRTLPGDDAALLVLDSFLDPLSPTACRQAVVAGLAGVRPGGLLAIAASTPGGWIDTAGAVLLDLAPGRPWHEATFAHVALQAGATHVATHQRDGSQLVVLRR